MACDRACDLGCDMAKVRACEMRDRLNDVLILFSRSQGPGRHVGQLSSFKSADFRISRRYKQHRRVVCFEQTARESLL
jgi:hypothetical protein